jgi:predicted dehydrogenase
VEAGLPIFIDKPLCDSEPDLKTFNRWVKERKHILSSSGMRYDPDFVKVRERLAEVGEPRYLSMSTAKTWERYGIHAAEGLYPILGPGFLTVRNTGSIDRNIVHCKHRCGADVVFIANKDMFGGFCRLSVMGTKGSMDAAHTDTFSAFKGQLVAFINFLRTGDRPFPWSETLELMKIVIAGIRSREEGGREVSLEEIHEG